MALHRELYSVLCDLNGNEIHKRRYMCICTAGPLYCTVETNTTLYSNDTPIKKIFNSCYIPLADIFHI